MTNLYWAARPTKEIAAEIERQFSSYQDWLERTGYLDRVTESYRTFNGINKDGTVRLSQSEDGAITKMSVNHFKNLLKRLQILITQNKLSFTPRARNTDAKSQVEADLAKGILEYYTDEKKMSGIFAEAVETALVCFEAFVHCPWDPQAGEELAGDVETGSILYTGDQAFEVLTALDVARNQAHRDTNWHIVRLRKNKYDLAAQHPQFADEIINSSTKWEYNLLKSNYQDLEEDASDLTDVYILYHKKTPALPKGREVWVCGSEVIKDGPLRYKKVPVNRLSAGDVIGQVMGDSPALELLPIQQMLDALFSAVGTNNLNFAVQNIHSSDPNLSITKLSDGMNLIHSAAAPTPLQLTNSSQETYTLIESMINQQQLLSGINSTARGNPESSLKSGNSLALMLAQAIQYVITLQQNYAQLASDVGSAVINNIQQFASHEMVATIGGISRSSYVKTFKAEDIMNIDRVSVDLGNPIMQTTAGKYELAQQMMQYGILKTPEQVTTVLKTGEIDSLTEDKFKVGIRIREENEMLKRGVMPLSTVLDNHPMHIAEHYAVLSDPELLQSDPDLVKRTLAHIQEHISLWHELFQLYPEAAAALQIPPPPPPPMQPGMEAMPPEGMEGPAPQGPAPDGMDPAQVNGTKLPSLPPNAPAESAQAYEQVQASIASNPASTIQ